MHQLGSDELYKLRLEMGMMFQTSGLFSDLTVYDNVAFPIRENFDAARGAGAAPGADEAARGRPARRARMMPADLSGGMTRRVALARAIATDPKLMMYDEPFAGLDPISLNQIVELIRSLNQALGLTSIVVTYDVHEALKVADYVYVIGDGVILGQGTSRGGRRLRGSVPASSSSTRCPTGRCASISPGRRWKRICTSMAEARRRYDPQSRRRCDEGRRGRRAPRARPDARCAARTAASTAKASARWCAR